MAGNHGIKPAACGGSKLAETTAAPAAAETRLRQQLKVRPQRAAESGSPWEPSTTVSIVVPAGAGEH